MPGPIRTSAPCSPRIPFGRLSPDLIAEDLSEVTYLAEQLLALAGTVTCLLKSSALLPPSSLPPTEGGTVADTLKGFDAIGRQFVDRLARKAAAFAEVATGEPVSGIHAPTAHHAVQEYARQFRDQLDALLAVVSGRLAESLAGFPAEQFRDHWPAIVEHCRRVPAYLDRFADDTSALRAATEREAFNASRRRGMTPPGPADTAASPPPPPPPGRPDDTRPDDGSAVAIAYRHYRNAVDALGESASDKSLWDWLNTPDDRDGTGRDMSQWCDHQSWKHAVRQHPLYTSKRARGGTASRSSVPEGLADRHDDD